MSVDPVAILAITAVTPVGSTAAQTCTSVRAGIRRLTEHPEYACLGRHDAEEVDEPVVCSLASHLPPELEGPERIVALALDGLQQLVRDHGLTRAELHRSALLIALPQSDASTVEWALPSRLADAFSRDAALPRPALVETNEIGHAGVFAHLARASALLAGGEVGRCIVIGVDTYAAAPRLALLDEQRRLKSDRNTDGFVPGEAAALVWLGRRDEPRPVASVERVHLESEPQTIRSDRQSTAAGLARCIRLVADEQVFDRVYCDLNGESYRFFEWGLVRSRLAPRFAEAARLVHPAESLGDVGAATGAVLVACALSDFRRRREAQPPALLWTSSDDGTRAAVRVAPAAGA